MKQGRLTILLLTALFVLSEILFTYVPGYSPEEIADSIIKVFLILLFILLFTKRLTWARWTLSVLLILFGSLYLVAAIIEETIISYYIVGAFDIFFGIYIHTSKSLKVYRTKVPMESTEASSEQMIEGNYPSLVKRYIALLTDALLQFGFLIVLMLIFQDSEYRPAIMITTAAILLLCYEPLLTVYSGTIGQKIMKLKVRRFGQPDRRLSLMNAYIRWLTKGLLGWISFITINFNTEHRAIHDFASDAIMLDGE